MDGRLRIAAKVSAPALEETRAHVRRGLAEDLPHGDITTESLIPPGARIRAAFVPRADGVLCGVAAVLEVFREVDPGVSLRRDRDDGDRIASRQSFLTVEGPARSILRAERLSLNFLQRLGGVATATRRYVDAIDGTGCLIYDTRKTTPGWRHLEKYAVRAGGGRNHRMDLSEFALIKDNHRQILEALGDRDLAGWIRRIREVRSGALVEVEIDGIDELGQALSADPDLILLDNFSLEDLRNAVAQTRGRPARRPLLEASGGIDLSTVRQVAETGVDRIAVGAITHSAVALDIGLDLVDVLT